MTDATVSLDPIWLQAAKDAVLEFGYGELIPREWLQVHLDMPDPAGKVSPDEYRDWAWRWLQRVESFKDCMLRDHKRLLVSVRGTGYRIVRPQEQTGVAMERMASEVRRSMARAMSSLVHINEKMLAMEDAQRNSEARQKLAWLKTVGMKKVDPQKAAPQIAQKEE